MQVSQTGGTTNKQSGANETGVSVGVDDLREREHLGGQGLRTVGYTNARRLPFRGDEPRPSLDRDRDVREVREGVREVREGVREVHEGVREVREGVREEKSKEWIDPRDLRTFQERREGQLPPRLRSRGPGIPLGNGNSSAPALATDESTRERTPRDDADKDNNDANGKQPARLPLRRGYQRLCFFFGLFCFVFYSKHRYKKHGSSLGFRGNGMLFISNTSIEPLPN